MSMFAERKIITTQLDHTIRFLNKLKGNMAFSPTLYSHTRNRIVIAAEPQKSPRMVALSQRYVDPPHSKARRNVTVAEAKSAKPSRSSDLSVTTIEVSDEALLAAVRSGMWTSMRIMAIRAPRGKLI
jgi:hypothetical protein